MPAKNISILGATGSIGRSTLAIAAMFPERFSVKALTARKSIQALAEMVSRFEPELAVVHDEAGAGKLKDLLPSGSGVQIMSGMEGYEAAAALNGVDTVISAMVGSAGLGPTLSAVRSGKEVALANKESLVMAGSLVMAEAARANSRIQPVDSEHSAIFQCIRGNRRKDVKTIILTASGGPFRNLPRERFPLIAPKDALSHPNWDMGAKISIDSATMMNKGLEVIEAAHLFAVSEKEIEVVVHPQSIVHSMVAYADGSVIAQMGLPDMKAAIAYALSGPERLPIGMEAPNFTGIGALTFEPPDVEKFPCLALAYHACRRGGSFPAALNAANEVAVEAFLSGSINFVQIPQLIEEVLSVHEGVRDPDLSTILEADRSARAAGQRWVRSHGEGVPA